MNPHEKADLERLLVQWRASQERWAIKHRADQALIGIASLRIWRQKRGISAPTLDEVHGYGACGLDDWQEYRQRARWRRNQLDSRARKRKRADELKPKRAPVPRVEITRVELKHRAKTPCGLNRGSGTSAAPLARTRR
jgi:hypothetical protein